MTVFPGHPAPMAETPQEGGILVALALALAMVKLKLLALSIGG